MRLNAKTTKKTRQNENSYKKCNESLGSASKKQFDLENKHLKR